MPERNNYQSDFYYGLQKEAQDIDRVLCDLVDITDDNNNEDKVVKVEMVENQLHFIAEEIEEGQTIDVQENEVPVGDGKNWVKESGFYFQQSIGQEEYPHDIVLNNYILSNQNDYPNLTINFKSKNGSVQAERILSNAEFSNNNVTQLTFGSNPTIIFNFIFNYKYGFFESSKRIAIKCIPGDFIFSIPSTAVSSNTKFFIDENEIEGEDGGQIIEYFYEALSGKQIDIYLDTFNSKYDKPNDDNYNKKIIIKDESNPNTGKQNKFILGGGAKVTIDENPYNNSSYREYPFATSINYGPSPEINIKGAVRMDIDSGYLNGTTNGGVTFLMHGGAHFDFSNASNLSYLEPVSALSGWLSNKTDVAITIHGNSRVLLDNSSDIEMHGDPYLHMINASFVMNGASSGNRTSEGFSNQCQFTMNNSFFNMTGPEVGYRPTLFISPETFNFIGHGNTSIGGKDNFPISWVGYKNIYNNSLQSITDRKIGPRVSIAGNTALNIGNQPDDDNNDNNDAYTQIYIGAEGNSVLGMDFQTTGNSKCYLFFGGKGDSEYRIHSGLNSKTNFIFGCDSNGDLDFRFGPDYSSTTKYYIQTRANGSLQYYLETDDGFVQIVDKTHIELQQEPKIIFRGWNIESNTNPLIDAFPRDYDENNNKSHLGLNWAEVLTTHRTGTYDPNDDYGTNPSPICQMLGPVNFTMRCVWPANFSPSNPHTNQHINSNNQPDAPLFEMTDTAEFRMWNNTQFKIDTNGVTISDGTTTLSFTIAQLKAIIDAGPIPSVGTNTF